MNAPYSFNFKYDPILENPFRSEIDYNKEIDERVRQLQLENIKDKIIESAIVNWFEDEDAGIEKVWNYFRAI